MELVKREVRLVKYFLVMFAITIIFSIQPNAYAAGSVGPILKLDREYNSYDLDNDRKNDRIKLVYNDNTHKVSLVVNGKTVYTLWGESYSSFQIISLANGKKFILVIAEGPNPSASETVILQYQKGKCKCIVDLQALMDKYCGGSYLENIRVSRNTIILEVSSMNWTVGGNIFTFQYQYKGGTLKRNGNIGAICARLDTAAKYFKAYKRAGSKATAFVVKKDQQVRIDKYYLKNGNLWFRVKNNAGKVGWIKGLYYSSKLRAGSPLFKYATYAG